jgi:hypothetical protein
MGELRPDRRQEHTVQLKLVLITAFSVHGHHFSSYLSMRARGGLRETPVNLQMHHHRWTRLTMLDRFCPRTGTWSIWLAHVHGLHIDYFSVCKIIQLSIDVHEWSILIPFQKRLRVQLPNAGAGREGFWGRINPK